MINQVIINFIFRDYSYTLITGIIKFHSSAPLNRRNIFKLYAQSAAEDLWLKSFGFGLIEKNGTFYPHYIKLHNTVL